MLTADICEYVNNKNTVKKSGFFSGKLLEQFNFYMYLGVFKDTGIRDQFDHGSKNATRVVQELGGASKYPSIYSIGQGGKRELKIFLGIDFLNYVYTQAEAALEHNEDYQIFKMKKLLGMPTPDTYRIVPPGDVLIKDRQTVKYYDGENWQRLILD